MAETLSSYLFYEIAALLVLAAGVGFVGLLLRQPLIVSYIAVGIIAGPSGLDIAQSSEPIELLAALGIALLLFLVGLKLDLKLVRELGPVALTTGLGQVAFTTLFGFLIGLGLGLGPVASLYVAIALTFSSTIIIVKLLSDKREIDSLHGRIALGFLIVQDIVVVAAMITLSAIGAGSGEAAGGALQSAAGVLARGGAMLVGVLIFIRYLATPLLDRLARAPELMLSFAVGWAALLAALGHYFGFGKELGGLLAGVSLASTAYRDAIAARLAPLRDFLLLFFFIALGAGLDLSVLGDNVGAALVFSAFVLLGNPAIVLAIMTAMGYAQRTGFLAGLTVAQISEFSLIFIAMGVSLGHVGEEALGLVTLVGLVTIAVSTYMITYSHQLFDACAPLLRVLAPRRGGARESETQTSTSDEAYDVVIFGLGRYGAHLADALTERGVRVLGVDFDPFTVQDARAADRAAIFGDATDPEFLSHLRLGGVKWVAAAFPDHQTGLTHVDTRIALMEGLRSAGFAGRIAIAAYGRDAVGRLREAGADLVLEPHRDAARQAAMRLAGTEDNAAKLSLDAGEPEYAI